MQPARPTPPTLPSATAHPKMLYRKLGRTGMDVSVLGMGSWVTYDYQLGVAQAKELIQRCYDAGINFVSLSSNFHHFYLLNNPIISSFLLYTV
jgi:aryl-alcohol dehydrogenase-like predicted oxidoreductase